MARRFPPPVFGRGYVSTHFVPSREARVYNCLVEPGVSLHSGSTAPTMPLVNRGGIVWGAKAKPPVFVVSPAALLYSARVARKCVMSGRVNWSRIASRNRMRRRGVEDVKGGIPIVTPPANKQPRRRLSKAELREQAWKARRGLSPLPCCAILLPPNSAKTVTDSLC